MLKWTCLVVGGRIKVLGKQLFLCRVSGYVIFMIVL